MSTIDMSIPLLQAVFVKSLASHDNFDNDEALLGIFHRRASRIQQVGMKTEWSIICNLPSQSHHTRSELLATTCRFWLAALPALETGSCLAVSS